MRFDHLKKSIDKVQSKELFFITGCMKSGTTWLQLLCNSHPEIRCFGEAHIFPMLKEKISRALVDYNLNINQKNIDIFKGIETIDLLDEKDIKDIITYITLALYAKNIKQSDNIKLIGEKTPDYLNYLDEIKDLFPGSKYIIINRDGRDTALSAWHHSLRISKAWLLGKYKNFEDFSIKFASHWNRSIRTAYDFKYNNKDHCLIVQYESLLVNKFQTVEQIYSFLNVDKNKKLIQKAIKDTNLQTLKAETGGQDSHFRKGISGDWRNAFDKKLNNKFTSIANEAFNLCQINIDY